METKFKVGDLVLLNEFGRLVLDGGTSNIGLITSGPRSLIYPVFPGAEEDPFSYWAYNVMIAGQLLIDVPQEFLTKMVEKI